MRLADLILLVPLIPVLIGGKHPLHRHPANLGAADRDLSGFGGVAIVLKSQALSVRVKPFIDAGPGRKLGGDWHVIFRHIVPNVLPLSFLYMMFGVTEAIYLAGATLSFFGLLNVPMSWGIMINTGSQPGTTCSAAPITGGCCSPPDWP